MRLHLHWMAQAVFQGGHGHYLECVITKALSDGHIL